MRLLRCAGLVLLALTAAGKPEQLFAQTPQPRQPQQPPSASAAALQNEQDAQSTRQQLFQVFQDYPPTVRRILQLDPTLMDRPDYLEPYPRLLAFLQQHPEIRRNPGFFVGSPDGRELIGRQPLDAWPEILAGTGVFIGFLTIVSIVTWLLRQLIDYRRWLRQSRVQTEVHTKILDRLQSNEELLAYIQSPAGRHFLESAPIAVESGPRPMGAPLGRILWSVQAGVVLATLGGGFALLQRNVPEEVAPVFYALGIVVGALGVGAMISAVVAYFLSARLGLLPTPKQVS